MRRAFLASGCVVLAALATAAQAQSAKPARPAKPPAAAARTTAAPAQPAPAAPATPPPPPVIYLVDQLFTAPLPQEVLKEMAPLHTLEDVEGVLKAHKLSFTWHEGEINSAALPGQIVQQVVKLPPHEVWIVATSKGVAFNLILSSRPAPEPAAPPPTPAPASAPARPNTSQ